MTEPSDESKTEQSDDQAVGHAVRLFVGSVFKGRQGFIILSLLVAGGSLEGYRLMDDPSKSLEIKPTRIERKLDDVAANVLETKITVKAMMDTMPSGQRERAQQLIKDRLEVLSMARNQAERSDP